MFTEQQLKAAHSKVKSGADFPAYVREIKDLGLSRYEFWVDNGHTVYYGANNHVIHSEAKYPIQDIALQSSAARLQHIISTHQQGQTDFITFCRQAADAGVEKWVIDTNKMTCVYYNLAGNEMVSEPIPLP